MKTVKGNITEALNQVSNYNREQTPLSEAKEEIELTERLKPHDAKKSKYYGKQFDRKLELRKIKSFISGIQKLDKELKGFQNNGGFYGPSKILDGLADAENEAYNYQWEIEQGRWDGEIEVDS